MCDKAGDFRSTAILALQIVEISHDFLSFDEFLRNLSHIAKKRSQYKQAIIRLVKRSMEYLGQVSDIEKKLSLIETLREITEGKVDAFLPSFFLFNFVPYIPNT